jgi:hypothetical protein
MSTRNIWLGGGGKGARGVLSWNLGASTSWNPLDLSRPVMGLIFALGCTVVRYFKWCEMSPCLASKLTQCRTTVSRSWWLSHVRSQLNSGNSSYGINYCFYSSLAHCTDQLVLNWIRQIIILFFFAKVVTEVRISDLTKPDSIRQYVRLSRGSR